MVLCIYLQDNNNTSTMSSTKEEDINLIKKNYYVRNDQIEFLDKVKKEKKWRSAAQVVRDAIDLYIEHYKQKGKNKSPKNK